MAIVDVTRHRLERAGRNALERAFRTVRHFPFVRDKIAAEYEKVITQLRKTAKPYRDQLASVTKLPATGRVPTELLAELEQLRAKELHAWSDGFVSGAVYHGDAAHHELLDRAYAMYSQANPLHADLWPSVNKFEAEIVAMTADMLGAGAAAASTGDEVCGSVTSGGTESILLAMKGYRDHARETRGITSPQIILPQSAHVAFDKAGHYFGIEMVRVPVAKDYRADVDAMARLVTRNTIALVGSAPGFPHGVIDPIEELSALALRHGLGLHVDGCLGGFFLPFARKLGRRVPGFDFALDGVTSMSADTHKFGYAAKGTSVLLWRNRDLRRHQYFTATDWPGGMYCSPTIAGSRPGGLSAAAWVALQVMGESGYLDATKRILEAADTIREGIENTPGIHVMGDPLFVIAFESDDQERLNVYQVLDAMTKKGWHLNGLHRPPCVHITVTLRHAQPGVAERFVADLRDAVEWARAHPGEKGGMAPVYGMAGSVPVRGVVSDLMTAYMDVLYEA
jgi:glutamate/tyrosine decarboxylase-like PLP-dependent enzyme